MSRSKTMAPAKERFHLDRLSFSKTGTHALNTMSASVALVALVNLGWLPDAWQTPEVLVTCNSLVSTLIYGVRKLLSRYE